MANNRKRIKFSGVRIDNLTMQEVINKIEKLIKEKKSSYIVTPNAAHIVLLQKDKEFKEVYKHASLVLCDSMPLFWATKILGFPLKQRITGTDLLFSLSKLSLRKNYKIFFLGAKEQIIEKASENLQHKFPNLQIAGIHNGYFSDNNKTIEKINKVKPDMLFIGMGFPKQEKWIHKYIDQIDTKVIICIGGVFDVVAGKTKRAPMWMQKCGLEWFFRVCQEPRRLWKRYLISNTIFIWLVLKQFIKIRILGRQD